MSKHFLNVPAVYKFGTRWINSIPKPLAYAVSQTIAYISYISYKSAVNNIKHNFMKAFPKISDKELSRLTIRLFRNYSKYLVDYGRFTNLSSNDVIEKIIYYDGKENLDAALAMNKGIILLTAHLGNWELGGIFFGSHGIKTNVITVQDKDPRIDDSRRRYRERHNVNTITVGNSPFSTVEMIKALNNQEVVAMLIDRHYDGMDCLTTNFFSKPTAFPRGPFILSRLTGAPIIVAFVVKEHDEYKGIIERPLIVVNEKDEIEILNNVAKILEQYIILYPDQWYNFVQI